MVFLHNIKFIFIYCLRVSYFRSDVFIRWCFHNSYYHQVDKQKLSPICETDKDFRRFSFVSEGFDGWSRRWAKKSSSNKLLKDEFFFFFFYDLNLNELTFIHTALQLVNLPKTLTVPGKFIDSVNMREGYIAEFGGESVPIKRYIQSWNQSSCFWRQNLYDE